MKWRGSRRVPPADWAIIGSYARWPETAVSAEKRVRIAQFLLVLFVVLFTLKLAAVANSCSLAVRLDLAIRL
jgi:hypothetical protein